MQSFAGRSQLLVKLTKDEKVISWVACDNPPSQMYVAKSANLYLTFKLFDGTSMSKAKLYDWYI